MYGDIYRMRSYIAWYADQNSADARILRAVGQSVVVGGTGWLVAMTAGKTDHVGTYTRSRMVIYTMQ